MDNLWGKCKNPPVTLECNNAGETKASIRRRVWEFMEKNDIASLPRPVYDRIPNFKGSLDAGKKLAADLAEFHTCKTVRANADRAQEEVRYRVLTADKSLLVAGLELKSSLLNRISPEPTSSDQEKESLLRILSSKTGFYHRSKPLPLASRVKIDLIVLGSVAVDLSGRRIGRGSGYEDLEFALSCPYFDESALVVTTVHDCQVFEKGLPPGLFAQHDIPVDVIVTPTRLIRVENPLQKPDTILWNLLTREQFDSIVFLKEIRYKEKRAGKNVKLMDDVEVENLNVTVPNRKFNKSNSSKRRVVQPIREGDEASGVVEIPMGNAKELKRYIKKKKHVKNGQSPESSDLFFGRIPPFSYAKELKKAISNVLGEEVKPIGFHWKGHKGFAFVSFDASVGTPEEICEKLKDIKLKDTVIFVEPDNKGVKKSSQRKEENEKKDEAEDQSGNLDTTPSVDNKNPKSKKNQPLWKKENGKKTRNKHDKNINNDNKSMDESLLVNKDNDADGERKSADNKDNITSTTEVPVENKLIISKGEQKIEDQSQSSNGVDPKTDSSPIVSSSSATEVPNTNSKDFVGNRELEATNSAEKLPTEASKISPSVVKTEDSKKQLDMDVVKESPEKVICDKVEAQKDSNKSEIASKTKIVDSNNIVKNSDLKIPSNVFEEKTQTSVTKDDKEKPSLVIEEKIKTGVTKDDKEKPSLVIEETIKTGVTKDDKETLFVSEEKTQISLIKDNKETPSIVSEEKTQINLTIDDKESLDKEKALPNDSPSSSITAA